MKTITEFHVATLKIAHKTRQELLTAGKTAEELPAALGEALKLEGDKLANIIAALEFVEADTKSKTLDLKRVIVSTLTEKETAPATALQKGDFYFAIEYFPPLPGQEKKQSRGRDGDRGGKGRDGKRGDRKGKGKGGPRGDRGDRPNRGPGRDAGAPGENRRPPRPTQDNKEAGAGGGARPPREPRAPRPPRPPRIPIVPPVNDGQPRFKVIVKSAGETAPSAPSPEAPATETPKSETT